MTWWNADKKNWVWCGLVCMGFFCFSHVAVGQDSNVIYVKADAVGANDGRSWTHAYTDLQGALAVVAPDDQIWVAAGTYTPSGQALRTATFQLITGVSIFGGFAGTEVMSSERDPAKNLTILSGDLLGNDLEVSEPSDLARESTRSDNSYHVVTGSGADETAVLDGFVITGGNANAAGNNKGGGMINVWSSNGPNPANPTLVNCHFHRNSAAVNGGGIYNEVGMPTFIDCVFSENHANGGIWEQGGGGMYNERGDLTVHNCRFEGNTSAGGGAGLHNRNASPTITDTVFNNNVILRFSHDNNGGGILNNTSDATILNCTFIENVGSFGGGVWNYSTPAPTLVNCIFSRNRAAHPGDGAGGGLQNWTGNPTVINCTFVENSAIVISGGLGEGGGSHTTVSNSIFWGNSAPSAPQMGGGSTTVTYSCVQGGKSGEGNIDTDPSFVDAQNGDFRLKSEAGRWDPLSEIWIQDESTSPCIDRGNPNSPIGDEPDPNGGIINMGAYGGTPEASMSIGHPAPLPPLAHWMLDEAEGEIAFDNAHENDAAVMGGAVWQPGSGQVDGALQFDGINDYVRTPFVLNPTEGTFSVFAWIKGGMPRQTIISQEDGTDWLLTDTQGCIMTTLVSEGRRPGDPLFSEMIVTDGNWHRVGLVWDRSHRSLYVDDELAATDVGLQSNFPDYQGGLHMGTSSDLQSGSFWSGLIDDVRIYDRVVTP